MAETVYDKKAKGRVESVDIHEIMNRWRLGVKRKQRGIASFEERVAMRLEVIRDALYPDREPVGGWEKRRAVYRGPGDYDYLDADWQPFALGDTWGEEGMSAFFRCRATVPERFAGRKVMLRVYVGGDSLLRVDGEAYHGIDPFHSEAVLADAAEGGRTYDVEIESYVAWHAEKRYPFTFALAELAVVDTEVWDAYWDIYAAIKALDIESIDAKLERFLADRLWDALKRVPLQADGPGAIREGVLAAAAQVRETVYATDRFAGEGMMDLVGHSHLDVVFMWPYKEFLRKVGRTHATMLRLMEQYPEFSFCQSQAKLYADMKAHWPHLYEQVKQRVAEGRWELTGAFWVEPDCNTISGESFVRQILYGQKFFEEEFGKRSRSCWQPDVFGLSWAMPQILARSGIEFFMTNKMAIWNDTNPWTRHTFWWEGRDGTRILSIVPPGHFIGTVDPDIMDRQWRTFSDKHTIGETLHVFGWGDGGGGPDPEMIESGRRYADFPGLVRTQFVTAEEAFDRIRDKALAAGDAVSVLKDEIYLEAHRGTYTNKGILKKINRRLEFLYRDAEMVAALAALDGAPYPEERFRQGWEQLLTTQFHDSLPGTHVPEVTGDLHAELDSVRAIGGAALEDALAVLFGTTPDPAEASAVTLVNTLPFDRDELAALPAGVLGGKVPAGPDGKPLPHQNVTDLDGTERVLVGPPAVPGVGALAVPLATAGGAAAGKAEVSAEASGQGGVLENALLKATFNADGELTSLFDKEHHREVLVAGAPGNRFQLFEDTPGHYEAWDIAATYVEHEIDVSGGGTVAVDEAGPLRASLRVQKPIAGSSVRQRVSLTAGSRELVFETEINWKERQRLLKVAFPLEITAMNATYDIAFGSIERPTHTNTSFDEAKFEVPTHLWADLSQTDYGVSLLNDCKYGYDCRGKVLRLTLLKGATYPDPQADVGTHHFTYVLMPHAGSWQEGGTHEAALRLNVPLVARPAAEVPAVPARRMLDLDAPGMTLEAVKRAEDGGDLILRLVEREGRRMRGAVRLERPVTAAWSCDLMETKEAELPVKDGAVRFEARAYEFVTLRLSL